MDILLNKIIRSNRKSVCLQVTHNADLVIRAPWKTPLYIIEQIINEKKPWIEKRQKLSRKKLSENTQKKFIQDEKFLYLGNEYPLTITDSDPPFFLFNNRFYLSKNHITNARDLFINWYKEMAAVIIKNRLDLFSLKTGLKYNKFNISKAKRHWGSCTPANTLNFNWRLIMAPLETIDYVIAHELAHLVERNHSKHFWKQVSNIFPAFTETRLWLKKNSHKLDFI